MQSRKRTTAVRLASAVATLVLFLWPAEAARPASAALAPCASRYTVQAGDTLGSIAPPLGTTAAALAQYNALPGAGWVYAGQVLVLPPRPGCPHALPPAPGATPGADARHLVQRGETLAQIDARYGIGVRALMRANLLDRPAPLEAGQVLLIPAWGAPPVPGITISNLVVWPPAPEQGRVLWLSLPTVRPGPAGDLASVAGRLGDWPVNFFRHGQVFVGLVGVPAMAAPGTYTLALELTSAAGEVATETQRVRVVSGGYGTETITLDPGTTAVLDPALTIPERERVLAAIAPVTPARAWQGRFRRPAAGQITSFFGTRRSYNGAPATSYHAGVDFSHRGGLDITAPAAGTVVLAERLTVRGNATLIDHGWGVYSGFWHQAEIGVRVGEVVTAGQVIGQIGSTGLSTGAHLHWELFVNGTPVDALGWTASAWP